MHLPVGLLRVHDAPWEYQGASITAEDEPNLMYHGAFGDREVGPKPRLSTAAWFCVDQTYSTPSGHQGYLEPQACIAEWDSDGRLQLWLTNKSPYAAGRNCLHVSGSISR